MIKIKRGMRKRGALLPEEVVKIVISLIVIALLVVLLSKLYFNSVQNKELEQAKASLENLIEQIGGGAEEVTIFNPEYLAIMSWPYLAEGKYPKDCSKKSCLCICNIPNNHNLLFAAFNRQNVRELFIDECNTLGVCIENPEEFVISKLDQQGAIKIEPPLTFTIDYENKTIG